MAVERMRTPERTRVAISGSNGQLGRRLQKLFKPELTLLIDMHNCDITDNKKTSALLRSHAPEVIINCAALTDVDGCERNPNLASAVNAYATYNIAMAAKELGARLIHVSTDYVFDGTKGSAYTESDKACPINIYGMTKLEGELAVTRALDNYVIMRTAWLYGSGNNFVRKILELAKTRERLKVVYDQHGSPTYAKDLAQAIAKIACTQITGIFHCANEGGASRLELAKEAIMRAGLNTVIMPVDSSAFPVPARRPSNTMLDCSKLKSIGIRMRPWKEALSDYLNSFDSSLTAMSAQTDMLQVR